MVKHELEKYEHYRDSGVEWLGDVPSAWLFNRHKDNFTLVTNRCLNPSLVKVGLENIEGKTGRFITTESEFDGDGIEFKENDILFGKLRPYLAKVYLSKFNGNAVGDIFVYRPQRNTMPEFAQYLMLSDKYIDVINSSTAGAKMPRVSSSFVASLPIATPTLIEQKAIVNYLNTKTAQIDRKIDLLTQKATKYGELKQSLINETVTRGLDKNVAMKDSGVEWIGEVPEHWELKRFCDIFLLENKIVSTTQMEGRDVFHYSIPVVQQTGTGQLEDGSNIDSNKALIKGNELLFSKLNPRKETICITSEVNPDILTVASGEFLVLKPLLNKIFLKYGFYIFSSNYIKEKICSTVKSVTKSHQRANPSDIFKMPQYVPPYEEQKAIADYLDTKTAHIDRIIETINIQIKKLKELRKTLINDVVTGKLKVYK